MDSGRFELSRESLLLPSAFQGWVLASWGVQAGILATWGPALQGWILTSWSPPGWDSGFLGRPRMDRGYMGLSKVETFVPGAFQG